MLEIQKTALEAIEKQLNELDKIKEFLVEQRYDLAMQYIDRWKNRTIGIISEKVNANEADKFSKIRILHITPVLPFDRYRNIQRGIEKYKAFLISLYEEVRLYGEEILKEKICSTNIKESNMNTLDLAKTLLLDLYNYAESNKGLGDLNKFAKNYGEFDTEKVKHAANYLETEGLIELVIYSGTGSTAAKISARGRILVEESRNKKKMPLNNEKIKILFLASDPSDQARLRLGQEFRDIQEKLNMAKMRDNFLLENRLAVRPQDIIQSLHDLNPRILHFSGHGTDDGELCFEDNNGLSKIVEPKALESLFELFRENIDCVLLNTCFSKLQAKAISNNVKYVIGMKKEIGDEAAIAFAVGFYRALGAGRSIKDSFKFGIVEIRMQGIPEHLTPVLFENN